MESVLRELTQKDALLDLFVNREDLMRKVEFGGHLGQSNCESPSLKSKEKYSKTSALDKRKRNSRLLRELVSKIIFLHMLGLSVLVSF